tara:strand:+ start:29 stop:631 length:603 start_codon:yes stop_codon:yes gene_type:complete
MKRKIILVTIFIIIFFSFLIFFYLNSNYNNELIKKGPQAESIEREDIEKIDEIIESSNIIEDVSYSAKDTRGNEYFLKATEGTIDQSESDYIFLKSVNAIVNLKDYKIIEISSDFGKYNIKNYDTIFSKNVIIKYLDNKITGDYLDFSWEKNFMIISRDVILENNENSLQADVIEVNIKTRDIKIFMYEENKKINIQTSN